MKEELDARLYIVSLITCENSLIIFCSEIEIYL